MLKKALRGEVAQKTEDYLSDALSAYFLIDVTCHEKSGHIRVYVDGDQGVQFDVLRQISRHLEEWLDERDDVHEAYELEVSSPGAKRPLKLLRQYGQHVGRTLSMVLVDGTSLDGELTDVHEASITVVEQLKGKKKQKKEPAPRVIEFHEIKEAKVKLSFG